MMRTKVLVVDDSALMRRLLTDLIQQDPSLEVVGSAADPMAAIEKIRSLNPDVLTLDVEMPRMDGLTFLEKLMRSHPLPVVMVSSLTESGCDTTLKALELGAVDFVTKPKLDLEAGTRELGHDILEKVRAAARARIRSRGNERNRPVAPAKAVRSTGLDLTHKVIAIGASTGGTEALREVLTALPADAPGVVVVQHMPEKFTRSFAARLDSLSALKVVEAQDGQRVLPGHAFIAPGNLHMKVVRSGAETRVRVGMSPPVNHHRPSVDVLFDSCARHLGANAVGVILTGMGSDGARGMLSMRDAGARTVAQDEASCVVYGMPKEAFEMGAAEEVQPLDRIPDAILRLLSERSAR